MITREQALTENHFHCGECTRTIGPKGGEKVQMTFVRRTGRTQTWKTRPNEFRVPVKHGLRDSGYITQDNAHAFHLDSDCPVRAAQDAARAALAV
jgi:hypothetical protein